MNKPAGANLSEAFAAALDWWREAGVDHAFEDAPRDWHAPVALEEVSQTRPKTEEQPFHGTADQLREASSFHPISWPLALEGFAQWWLTEPRLDEGRVAGRIAPRGAKGAQLMVVVPEPEREDRQELLSGPQGRLLRAILSAMGIQPGRVYLASVLPRHTPAADWQAIAASWIGEVLRHHIGLVAPERLLTFGGNILPLIGNDPPQASAVLREFNHEGRSIPLLAARSLSSLLEKPRWKAELWRVWLGWSDQASAGRGTKGSGYT